MYDRTPAETRSQAPLKAAAENYRRAAALSRDRLQETVALERLAEVYGEKYLDEPGMEESVLRELVRLMPDKLTLHFRIARLQEKMGAPDGAESTLLNVRYLYPDKQMVYRELAGFYARRTTALPNGRQPNENVRRLQVNRTRMASTPSAAGFFRRPKCSM